MSEISIPKNFVPIPFSYRQEIELNIDDLNNAVDKLLKKEVASGVQTIQYQIQTLATANGR